MDRPAARCFYGIWPAELPPHAGEAKELTPDSELVALAQSGDDDAFSKLAGRHRERAFHAALAVLGASLMPEAEDAAQSAIIRAYQALPSLREDASFGAWLCSIARNEALNTRARARHRLAHLGEESLQGMAAPAVDFPEAESARRRRILLDECISGLPSAYQSTLRLYYWLDWSVAEIAAHHALPENTVKSYLHRGRRLLQQMLVQRGYTDA